MTKKKSLNLISLGLFYVILFSMEAWFLARVPTWMTGIIEIVLILYMFNYLNTHPKYHHNRFNSIFMVIFLLIAVFWNYSSSFGIAVSNLLSISIMFVLMRFTEEDRLLVLHNTTKWFSILLSVSVTAWLIHFIIPLPSFGHVYRAGEYYESINYLFFTELPTDIFRFKSVFLEPGHVSTIATFFVAANRFDFKNRYVLLLSLCIIPTFGLAGYVLFVLGYLFYSIEAGKANTAILRLAPMVILFIAAVFYFRNYNNGDNLFNELILNRLEYNEEKGVEGNDRSSWEIDKAFDEAVDNGTIIIGIDRESFQQILARGGHGAGAKVYTLQHGIIGSLFLLLGYFCISKDSRYKRWAFFMFLIYAISFLQRVYFFWGAYYIPYICAMAVPPREKHIKIDSV